MVLIRTWWFVSGLVAVHLLAACSGAGDRGSTATGIGTSASGRASAPTSSDDGQWLMAAKDFASQRYSALTDIKSDNVGSLKLAWTFSTGVNAGHEAAPLVVNSTLEVVTTCPYVL